MTKKPRSKIDEDKPIRKRDIAAGRLVLRQRTTDGELLSANKAVVAAIKRRPSKR